MAQKRTFVPFLALLAAFFGQFVCEGVMISFTVLYPDLVHYFRVTNAQISLVGSLAYGCWFLIGPFSGKLVDKFGPVKVIMISGAVGAIGCLLAVLAKELWHIMITFGIIFGTCCGLAFIPSITAVGFYFKKHHHLATTAATIGGATGGVVYPLCIKIILHAFPWQFCFAFIACTMLHVVVCGAVFHMRPIENDNNQKSSQQKHETILLRVPSEETEAPLDNHHQSISLQNWRRNMIIFAVHNFFWNFGDFAAMTILPLYLSHNDFSTDDIALVISIYSFATMLGRLAAAGFSAWPKGDRIFLYNLSTILAAIFLWLFCIEGDLELYLVVGGGFGFMFGVQTALVPSATIDLVGKDRTNMALGLAIFASGLAGLSSPYAAGLLSDITGDYCMVFRICSILGILPYFIMIHLHWPLRNAPCLK